MTLELENSSHLQWFPEEWEIKTIQSLCEKTTSGGTPSRKNPDFYKNGNIIWLKTKELKDWYIDDSEEKITNEALAKSSAKLFPINTVLIAMYGDGRTITSLGILRKPAATNQACCALIPDLKIIVPLYLLYLLKFHKEHLIKLALGGAQRNLSVRTISNFQVKIPPLATQRKIAGILSAYDDLIENNTRRIEILEEMARMLYREWFVKFRFPVDGDNGENGDGDRPSGGVGKNDGDRPSHNHLSNNQPKLIESELGLIPEDWEIKTATEALEVKPKVKVPKEGEKPFVPMGCLSTNSMLINDVELRSGNSGSKFQNGDTLFARITPCLENGKTGYVQFLPSSSSVAFGSTEFLVLRSKTLCPEYVYLMARSDDFRENAMKSMTGATGRQRVKEECFEQFKFAHPPQPMLEKFAEMVSPYFQKIFNLNQKNINLRKTRDLLLPRLISGEIDIEDLDINLGATITD
ncbi:restriction endonuclease subunit S [Picosynechococcus sp. PCC 8807]|uniref:restriction endonuclease subunit S n=1 Tax=Picosynechococcus sp. PCC 8807 TaxID=195248 RepID=UPI0009032735|nr:restriction endonuclease subunit S [Picosynechococcus sp. PCC 8807]